MISAIKLKKHIIDASIFGVIIGKLSHREELCLIILIEVDKGSNIDFYCAILLFSLAIYLRVEGSVESLLDA